MGDVEVKREEPELWYIRYPPDAIEWEYLCEKLRDSIEETEGKWSKNIHMHSGDIVFTFNRADYPAANVSKYFGVSEETLKSIIILKLKKKESPKAATVHGWGTA